MFSADTTMNKAITAVNAINGADDPLCAADDGTAAAGTKASSWAVSSALVGNTGKVFCVDSKGTAETGTKVAGLTANVAQCQ